MFFKPSFQLALSSCRQGSKSEFKRRQGEGPTTPIPRVPFSCPGGIENGGGIGRQMGYFLKEQERNGLGAMYTVVDTRGPRFIDGSVFYTFLAIFYLAMSLLRLLQARLFGGSGLAHINITGRGSTIRKIIVAIVARSVKMPYHFACS